MSLESAGGRLIPDRVQRQWLIAQTHIIERDGKFEGKELEAKLTGSAPYNRPDTEFLGAKEAFNEVLDKIKADEASPNRLVDQFLSEKSLNVHHINGNKLSEGAAESLAQQSTSARVNEQDEDEDYEIRKRISRIMADYAENNAVQDRKVAKHRYEDDEKYWKPEQSL